MRHPAPILILILAASLPACSTTDVTSDYKKGVDFSKYRTWAWIPINEMRAPDPMAQNERADRFIRTGIERELVNRGYPMRPGSPDFYVSYITGVKDDLGTTAWGYGYGGQAWAAEGIQAYNYREGTLIVDVIDADKRELIWRGWAEGVINTFEEPDQLVREAVQKIFAEFPPE